MESQHCTERSEHDLLVTNLEDRIKDLEAKVAELKAGRDELREQIEQDAKAVTLASGERVSTAEGRRLALLLAKKLKAERDELLSLYGHAPEARCVTIGDQDHFTDECDRCGLSLGHGVHTRADGAKPSEV